MAPKKKKEVVESKQETQPPLVIEEIKSQETGPSQQAPVQDPSQQPYYVVMNP